MARPDDKDQQENLKWNVSINDYSEDSYPPYCIGIAYFFSASFLPEITTKCPFHCIGLLNSSNNFSLSNCFWKWEDAFLGSCLNTFDKPPFALYGLLNGMSLDGATTRMAMLKLRQRFTAVHSVKGKTFIMLHNIHKRKETSSNEWHRIFNQLV